MPEKNLDFDKVYDRYNTLSLKYDYASRRHMPEGLLPLWVADMDFPTSSYIQEALIRQAESGIFGYSEPLDGYFAAVRSWMKEHYDFEINERWIVKTPGIVMALALAVKAFTKEGDGVLIQTPVYYPFYEVIEDNNRKIITNPLVYGPDRRYHIDFEDFERKIEKHEIKLFLLCNPHNPGGRVWTREELERLGDICQKYGVIVVSDEIHCDFVFKGKHTVFQTIKPEYAGFTITCTSPSKSFNLAGLQVSNIIISNQQLRRSFRKQVDGAGYSQMNVMGLVACEAAYKYGGEWLEAAKKYIKDNIEYTRDFVEKRLPGVTMADEEGTYLVWLDFRELGLCELDLERLIIEKAGLWLDSGRIFGKEGSGFQRINVAAPRKIVTEAMERLETAIKNLKTE